MVESKYGVMWASTNNIGDDIQTLAAINFLNKKGITDYVYVDREKLSDYDGEPIKLVMNGWFTNNVDKFLPSKNITPIFISVHINKEIIITKHKEYFKSHEPIGCRDLDTVKLFEKNGIDAYFTGCLTLFFDKTTEKNGGKYLVDVNVNPHIPHVPIDVKSYPDYKVIKHEVNPNLPVIERMKIANDLLNIYRNATSIITTRLHVMLPCRAFNTEAFFIYSLYDKDSRFTGLKSILLGGKTLNLDTDFDRNKLNEIQSGFETYKL